MPRRRLQMTDLRVRAIRFEQNGRVFYSAVIPAGEAIARSRVDVWSADVDPDEAGYQRAPMKSRLREVASYVEGENAILPLGGLLNARARNGSSYGQVLKFEPDSGDGAGQSGWLTIPETATPLEIVDMQHRLWGIRHAIEVDGRKDLEGFPVVVTIADGLSKMEEVEQFELINTTQKRVRTDLARRLMAFQAKDVDRRVSLAGRGRLWEAKGPMVADWLNKNGEVWEGRIIPPNKSKTEMPRSVVRETSFVTSLKPILQAPIFQRMSEEHAATLVDRYWQAIRRVWPKAFEYPNEHVIQKTPGVFSLHMLFPEVFELVRADSGRDLTADNILAAIRPWTELGEGFWEAGNEDGAARYGSMKGFSRLAQELREKLPELDFELA
jgi:DGQHR domain-containing protein